MMKVLSFIIYFQAVAGLRMNRDPYCSTSAQFSKVPKGDSAIVTYAGVDKQQYIDGAIMLGRALIPSFPSQHFECLVGSTMSTENKDRLRKAGWNVREVALWCPEHNVGQQGYWTQSFEKINAFRLPFEKVLFLDADTYIFSDDAAKKILDKLKNFGQPGSIPSDQILMATDINPTQGFNSGVMIFSPSEAKFNEISTLMDQGMLDQPAVNKAYEGKIQKLGHEYNRHAWDTECDDVIVSHFTGPDKPALADEGKLRRVKEGNIKEMIRNNGAALQCPKLYQEYYQRLQKEKMYLTPELMRMLQH